jgi:hypothetical protein
MDYNPKLKVNESEVVLDIMDLNGKDIAKALLFKITPPIWDTRGELSLSIITCIILALVTVMLLLAVRGQHKELMKKTKEHWRARTSAYGLKGDFTAPPDDASPSAERRTPRVGLVAPRPHSRGSYPAGAAQPPLADDSDTDQLPTLPTAAHNDYGDRAEVRHGRGPQPPTVHRHRPATGPAECVLSRGQHGSAPAEQLPRAAEDGRRTPSASGTPNPCPHDIAPLWSIYLVSLPREGSIEKRELAHA